MHSISAPYLDEVIDWFDEKEIFINVSSEVQYTDEKTDPFWRVLLIDKSTLNLYSCYGQEREKYTSRTKAKEAGITKAIEIYLKRKKE